MVTNAMVNDKSDTESTNKTRRILACRPQAQNASWCAFLESKELQVLDMPLLQISDIENFAIKQSIKEYILRLDKYDYLIFVSQNAVKHAFDWIDDFWPQLPEQQRMFAVGKKTAAAIQEICSNFYPASVNQIETAKGNMTSEALLAHDDMLHVENKNILIFKGAGGRRHLQETLAGRGANVECCELYERSLPDAAIESFADLELDKDKDVFVVFSGETLSNLNLVLSSNPYSEKKAIPLLVPGARVGELAESMGYQTIFVAENASEESMWQALSDMLSTT